VVKVKELVQAKSPLSLDGDYRFLSVQNNGECCWLSGQSESSEHGVKIGDGGENHVRAATVHEGSGRKVKAGEEFHATIDLDRAKR
jgi:hypothetical protein